MIIRIWRWVWSPSKYKLGFILIVGGLGGIIFWGGFHTAMEATNSLEFCISCHEMKDTVYQEYKKTIHYTNSSGVRAVCSDCHVPKDWAHKVVRKIKATGELYHKLIGTINTSEKFETHRLEMARNVWAEMEANDSRECRNCHSFDVMDLSKQKKDVARKQHAKALQDGDTCIDCHKGIAHKKPSLGKLSEVALKKLEKSAAAVSMDAKNLYPIRTKSFFLSPNEGQNANGKILAAAELTVLERKGNMLKVRIDGWQQEDVAPIVYARPGKRIFVATLDKKARKMVRHFESEVDPLSDLTFYRTEMTAWITKEDVVSSREDLWAYASELYYVNCSMCHRLPDPEEYMANQWIGNFRDMKELTSLNKEELRLTQIYVQLHASDVGGHVSKLE